MRTRHIVAVAALVPLVAAAAPADAAKRKPPPRKPVCLQIKDAPDDATGNGTGAAPTPSDPSSDIISADVATNATWLTAVIRLASVDENLTSSPTGRAYTVTFLTGGRVQTVRAKISRAGAEYFEGKGQGAIDAAAKTVVIHAKLADFTVPIKPNAKLEQLKATTQRYVGSVASLGVVDTAVGVAPYVVGWPTCVPKVGP